jgi:BolA protein
MTRQQRIISLLTEGLNPTRISLDDDSDKHAGHSGARPGGQTHYTLAIESEAFRGKSKIQRHQMIYALLGGEFKSGLHALAIHASAPGE